MLIAERLISSLINTYGRYPVSSDGGTKYSQDYKFLKLKHHLHFPSEKSIIEITIHYIKARLNDLMITFHVDNNCKLNFVRNWLRFFNYYHNKEVKSVK
jgi:hypothetical protein